MNLFNKPAGTDADIYGRLSSCVGRRMPGTVCPRFLAKTNCSQVIQFPRIKTVRLALETFKSKIQGKHIQIVSDNITTVAYLNHLGGPCQDLNSLATGTWELALQLQVKIPSRHIAGRLNIEPDTLSRLNPIYEWQLNPNIFTFLDTIWGPLDIDRFATMANTQLSE